MPDPYNSKDLRSWVKADKSMTKLRDDTRSNSTKLMMANIEISQHNHRVLHNLNIFKNDGAINNPYNRPHTAYDTAVYFPPDLFNRGRYNHISYK